MKILANNLTVVIITIIGVLVLIGINKLSADIGIPLVSALAGVHVGANTIR